MRIDGDIVNVIWDSAIEAGDNLATAEGRTALDKRLRAALAGLEDADLRRTAADMIRVRRMATYAVHDRHAAFAVLQFILGQALTAPPRQVTEIAVRKGRKP